MDRDTLILIEPDFVDPAYPGVRFYCWQCALIEGVLAGFPGLPGRVDVRRVPWPRPRAAAIELLGEAYQSLPVLVLAQDSDAACATGRANGRAFVAGKDAILAALAIRHGIPVPHP